MGKFYKDINSAPFEYVTSDGELKKLTLVPINGVKISNSFDISYIRGIANFFNAMMSRFMYHAIFDKNGKERPYPKAQNHIYFPADQMSEMINKCESQCYNIKNQLEDLFDLDITRSSANRFRLSERVAEFLHVFSEKELYEYMEKYNITASHDKYRLLQIYHYRAVRPSDKNWDSPEQRREFEAFINDKKHKDYNHYLQSNHVKDHARIQKIELHIDLLSDKQKEQLRRIKEILVEGITDLAYRFHWKLIELQQFVTGMLTKDRILGSDAKRDIKTSNSQVINRNKTEGEQHKTEEVAAAHKKDPEVDLQVIAQVATFWNIMADGRDMEIIRSLSNKKIQSINNIVKSIGKEDLFQIIENTGYLLINSPIMFEEFMSNSDRLNKVLKRTYTDSRFTDDEIRSTKEKTYKFKMNFSPVSHDKIPQFNSKAEAKSWFKEHLNLM